MKALFTSLIALFLSTAIQAQVTLEVTMDQDQYIAGESVIVAVRVVNYSGRTITLGRESDWLKLSVGSPDGFVVQQRSAVPVTGEFNVASSERGTRRVNLTPHFDFAKPGTYNVSAKVKIPGFAQELTSKPLAFYLARGTKVWEQEFGVPGSTNGPGGAPEVRKYALQQAMHLKKMRLYLRVTDPGESRVVATYALGPLLSFGQPEHIVDGKSNLHVLYQAGRKSFLYTIIDPDGRLTLRQTHDFAADRPTLKMSLGNEVNVVGGVRHPMDNDIPQPMAQAAEKKE